MSKIEELEEYFNFTQDDLRENREGVITEDQQLVLKEKTWKDTNVLLISFVGIGVIYVVVDKINNPESTSMTIPILLVVMAAIIIILRGIKRSDQSVYSVEGKIEFIWEEHKVRDANGSNYYTTRKILNMLVDEKTFQVREELMNILDQGEYCRFYYTGGGDILSAEVLNRR